MCHPWVENLIDDLVQERMRRLAPFTAWEVTSAARATRPDLVIYHKDVKGPKPLFASLPPDR